MNSFLNEIFADEDNTEEKVPDVVETPNTEEKNKEDKGVETTTKAEPQVVLPDWTKFDVPEIKVELNTKVFEDFTTKYAVPEEQIELLNPLKEELDTRAKLIEDLKAQVETLKGIKELPEVKEAVFYSEVSDVIMKNGEDWSKDFFEEEPELAKVMTEMPKELANKIAPELDQLAIDYIVARKKAGKQIINPLLVNKAKVIELIKKNTVDTTPKPKIDEKKLISLSGGGSGYNTTNQQPITGFTKKQEQAIYRGVEKAKVFFDDEE